MWRALVVLVACGDTPLPTDVIVETEPECSLQSTAEECAEFVGDCHECTNGEARWFECDDGWTSNQIGNTEAAEAEYVCHCDGNGCWPG